MPRKTKEQKELENKEKNIKKAEPVKNSTTSKKATTTKKTSTTKKSSSAKKTSITKKVSTASKSSTSKKSAVEKKSSTTKKTPTKKIANEKKKVEIVEYYDLPYRYNQTVVKLLAQTPTTLFIYWDISDNDRNSYVEKYGEDFFYRTKPYLIITNETMHYSFDVEINDFTNSWYLHVNDANCEYKVELGRKFVTDSPKDSHFVSYHTNDYLYITSSNEMEMPNNHILFDKLGKSVFFRNVKTNVIEEKNISSISFLQKIGKVYNIYDLYKEIYGDELIYDEFGLNLPSSNSSSSFK